MLSDDTRLALIAGTYQGRFQIPNNPDQTAAFSLAGVSNVDTGFNAIPSANLDQNQREQNQYVVASLQQKRGALDYQASLFYQYSKLHYMPDPQGGDLVYNGVASNVTRSNSAVGLQFDASYQLDNAHTPRFGGSFTHQYTQSDNTVQAFPTDDAGNPTSDVPLTIVDDSSKRGNLLGLYVQDEWRIDPRFTLELRHPLRSGCRIHHRAAVEPADQCAVQDHRRHRRPRRLRAQLHAAAAGAGGASEHRPVREHDRRAGDPLFGRRQGGENELLRCRHRAKDHGQLVDDHRRLLQGRHQPSRRRPVRAGADPDALQLRQGLMRRASKSPRRSRKAAWSGYLNLGIAEAKGKNIISGQSLFGVDELAYIADHYIYLDHDQRYSLSGGLTYRFGASPVSANVLAGSGLRNTPGRRAAELRQVAELRNDGPGAGSRVERSGGRQPRRPSSASPIYSTRPICCATAPASAWARPSTAGGARGSRRCRRGSSSSVLSASHEMDTAACHRYRRVASFCRNLGGPGL